MQIIQSISRRFLASSARFSATAQPSLRQSPAFMLRGYANRPVIENDDPTPDKMEGGPDRESIPGDAGGTKSVSESDAAFDPNTPKPQDSAADIEKETDKDMSRSAASNMPSDASTGQKQKKVPENKGRS
ncbi:uncharacterized protein FA14DRAFT_192666 [Meira miltonrushii]|uniref:Uncharacterized protein n=1 Tax=Meira miltonrushii TaxID=1280837 RepID=A0A316V2U2_9BASI|nr:uncharacterized protein FA14DRAFT_192666 [Meira miltonrushii]PWN31574.1 hypothetical protein FA14DRAFT_192666 [Meira miltonrushii]